MFRTYRHAEIPTAVKIEPGIRLWRSVEQLLHLPWFYVTQASRRDGVTVRDMLMVADVNSLERRLAVKAPNSTVETIYLVSPAYMNGTDHWLMEPLQEIAFIGASGGRLSHYRYTVVCDKIYTNDADPGLETEQEEEWRVVFSVNPPGGS